MLLLGFNYRAIVRLSKMHTSTNTYYEVNGNTINLAQLSLKEIEQTLSHSLTANETALLNAAHNAVETIDDDFHEAEQTVLELTEENRQLGKLFFSMQNIVKTLSKKDTETLTDAEQEIVNIMQTWIQQMNASTD